MSIVYNAAERVFKLDTPNTSYVIGIVGEEGFLGHIYYGKRLEHIDGIRELLRTEEPPFTPDRNARDRISFMDCLKFIKRILLYFSLILLLVVLML